MYPTLREHTLDSQDGDHLVRLSNLSLEEPQPMEDYKMADPFMGYYTHGGSSSDCTEADRSPESLALPPSVASSQYTFAVDEHDMTRDVPLQMQNGPHGMCLELPPSMAEPDTKMTFILPLSVQHQY